MTARDQPTPEQEAAVPDDVRLVRDFVNTFEPQISVESFETPAQLREWCADRGLVDTGARMTSSDLDVARDIREGLRVVLMSHAGHARDDSALATFNEALAHMPMRVAFDSHGGTHLVPSGTSELDRALAGLLEAIQRARETQTWERLKVCARDSCRWAFYDASRNRAGRWCSMAGCGNHVKMKRAYASRKARSSSQP